MLLCKYIKRVRNQVSCNITKFADHFQVQQNTDIFASRVTFSIILFIAFFRVGYDTSYIYKGAEWNVSFFHENSRCHRIELKDYATAKLLGM